MTIPAFPVYLFDVDGTLTDSAPDICGSVEVVLDKHGLPPQSRRYLQSFIGKHLQELWAELIPGLTPEHSETLTQEYRQVYWARNHSSTRLYPGVAEMLAALGGRKSTATTKGTPTTRVVLEMFGLIQFFDHIQGTDGFPAKPEPDVIHRSLAGLGASVSDCLFVGDSVADMEAGRRAGVRICGVRYGYGDLEGMQRFEPDYWIDHPSALIP